MIGRTGQNCYSSACPGKGQEKDRDECSMRGFEIFIKVVTFFVCRIDVEYWLIKLRLTFYLHKAVHDVLPWSS